MGEGCMSSDDLKIGKFMRAWPVSTEMLQSQN